MRLPKLDVADLNPAQQAVLDQIQQGPRGASGKHTGLVGPFGVWVRAPTVGGATQALGAAVRFASSLPADVREVAICTVGVYHRAKFEFAAHREMAVAAGVDANALDRLRDGQDPAFSGAEGIAHQIAVQLLNDHRLETDLYQRALEEFGEEGLIELVTTVGYYCLVSLTLNAFEVPLGDRMIDPFPGD
jgi:4-carboxymuconolactone decarboxylase